MRPLGDIRGIRRVTQERNIELRREMIEKEYGGYERFFQSVPHEILDKNQEGILRCIEFSSPTPKSFLERVTFESRSFLIVLEVADATHPEKHFFIPVHPKIKTVREARAWTFGMTSEEFNPIIET